MIVAPDIGEVITFYQVDIVMASSTSYRNGVRVSTQFDDVDKATKHVAYEWGRIGDRIERIDIKTVEVRTVHVQTQDHP